MACLCKKSYEYSIAQSGLPFDFKISLFLSHHKAGLKVMARKPLEKAGWWELWSPLSQASFWNQIGRPRFMANYVHNELFGASWQQRDGDSEVVVMASFPIPHTIDPKSHITYRLISNIWVHKIFEKQHINFILWKGSYMASVKKELTFLSPGHFSTKM